MTEASKPRVAVIGAGPLGLTALKQFREDGFDAVAFESRPYVGGLWKDSADSSLSVQKTTRFNSSKFRAAFSGISFPSTMTGLTVYLDLPFPEDADTYPTASQMHAYLETYAKVNGLFEHIKLGIRASGLSRQNDKWSIQLEDLTTKQTQTETFDKVCVAIGTFNHPLLPSVSGIEKFAGKVIHSIQLQDGQNFKAQNVLIIGLGASAQDCVSALDGYANKVYLSHRHGALMLPRYNSEGRPIDTTTGLAFMFILIQLERYIPSIWAWAFDILAKRMSKQAFPNVPKKWRLSSTKSLQVSTPLIADALWNSLQTGFAEPVPPIRYVTGDRTIELEDGRVLSDIDTIIYCTGYDCDIPKDLMPRPEKSSEPWYHPYPSGPQTNPSLYRNIFPLTDDESVRQSLCFLGKGGFNLPGFVQFELQAMAISQIWQQRFKLPSPSEALKHHQDHSRSRVDKARRYNASESSGTFYPIFVPTSDAFPWLDEVAGTGIFSNLGGAFNGLFNPKAWSLWWNDRKLYNMLMKGVLSPVTFRLFDMGRRKPLDRQLVVRTLERENKLVEEASVKQSAEVKALKKAS